MPCPVPTRFTFLFAGTLLMWASLPCRSQHTAFNGNKSNTATEDARLLVPKQQAQQQLGHFLESFRKQHLDTSYVFSTLVYFPETAERTWIVVKSIDGNTYTGYLSDVYENSLNLAAESLLRFQPHQIEDWRINNLANENTAGNFALTAQVEQALRDRQRVQLQEELVPSQLHSLISLATFWGISDDLVRAQLCKKATPEQKNELRRQLQDKKGVIEQWLVSYTSRFSHSPEEESFYYLLIANREVHGNVE